MSARITREELFAEVAWLYGQRSSCPRARVGAIAVRDGRIVAAGYNGAPAGQPHCLDVGCAMDHAHCVRAVHAEANLISWAARTGTPLIGTTLYCTNLPCLACTKLIINAGVMELKYKNMAHGGGEEAQGLLEEAGLIAFEP